METMNLNEFCEKNNIPESIWGISEICNSSKSKGVITKIIPDSQMPEDSNTSDIEIIPPTPLQRFFRHRHYD